MKIKLTFQTKTVVADAALNMANIVQETAEDRTITLSEIRDKRLNAINKVYEVCKEWVYANEFLMIEIDSETGTCRAVPVEDWDKA